MGKGRPPELTLDPLRPGPVVQAVATVDTRGRVQFPRKLLSRVPWLRSDASTEALAVLSHPGVVRLYSWAKAAPALLEKRDRLIQQANSDSSAVEMLRVLEDRYKRFQMPLGGRPTLTPEMVAHLGLTAQNGEHLYLWKIGDVLELNSVTYRNLDRQRDWNEFEDLPE